MGREEELAALRRFLGRPQDLPAALVVQGEAGCGKTTVFDAGIRAARGARFRVLSARPAETERDLSFAGLRDLLEATLVYCFYHAEDGQAGELRAAG